MKHALDHIQHLSGNEVVPPQTTLQAFVPPGDYFQHFLAIMETICAPDVREIIGCRLPISTVQF